MSKLSSSPKLLSRKDSSVDPLLAPSARGRGRFAACEDGKASTTVRQASEVRTVGTRLRGLDPTTCDPDYSPEELEFLLAIQQYKQTSGRKFPTWREVLEVLLSLGYERAR